MHLFSARDTAPAIAATTAHCTDFPRQSDEAFVHLLNAYRPSGGIARRSEVELTVCRRTPDGLRWLDHCIADGAVVCLDWQARLWLPVFQFEPARTALCPGVGEAVRELRGAMSDWQLLYWFSQPQCALAHSPPMTRVRADPDAVVDAARQARFVLTG